MAPGQTLHPTRLPRRVKAPAPLPKPDPGPWLQIDLQHDFWLHRTMEYFHQLILWGESQRSNGTLRVVERPDGESRFAVAYGSVPDDKLRVLLTDIYIKYGEVTLRHDGRDSTGKHWIKCFNVVHTWARDRPSAKAIICVSSKLAMATVPRPATRGMPGKGKNIAPHDRKDYPKVPGAVERAPRKLVELPLSAQWRWLEPAAAKALHCRLEAEEIKRLEMGQRK